MHKTNLCSYLVLVVVVALCQLGCQKHTLVYHHKSFKAQSLDVITVMPLVDARVIVRQRDDFDKKTKGLQKLITTTLKKKGYDCKVVDNPNAMGHIHPSQIPFLDAGQINEIGPANTKWVLLPVVEDIGIIGMGSTSAISMPTDAKVMCYLFEKRAGKLIWEGSSTHYKLKKAFKNMMKDFPSKK